MKQPKSSPKPSNKKGNPMKPIAEITKNIKFPAVIEIKCHDNTMNRNQTNYMTFKTKNECRQYLETLQKENTEILSVQIRDIP